MAGGGPRVRPYVYYDAAISICSVCYRKAEGKVLIEGERVFLTKRCPEHGAEKVLLADDAAYYRRARELFLKPAEMPARFNTEVRWGCPFDCGLCPDHEQHSCLTLVEVTDHCNLRCPVCYAGSGPERPRYRTLGEIEAMLDAIVANEREPDVVQISGGEPTLHPDFFAILDAARSRPVRHLMVNTNGVRIAEEAAFAERLAGYGRGFEVYLQMDSFERDALVALRGADLRAVHEKALARLDALEISTTLVVTVARGVNDGELGRIVERAAAMRCIRGVTLQPVQHAGRCDGFDPATQRLTLTEVRRKLLDQTALFRDEDLIPVPCHPDCLAMGYALKGAGTIVPLTGLIDPSILVGAGRSSIAYERDPALRDAVFRLFSAAHSPGSSAASLGDLLCCLPRVEVPGGLGYENVFRVLIVQFLDAHSLEVRSVKKTCVHIVHPDGRLIPFDTYNLFYRDDLEATRLGPIRRAIATA
ncbi:MAG: radical SAM protein [Acidobacteriota bacterium]